MQSSEKTISVQAKKESEKSMMVNGDVTLQSVLQVSSEMYEVESETPENSLIGQAQRLQNVAHSLIEEREQNYLNDKGDSNTRKIDSEDLAAVCKLSAEARENIRLAMDIKKDKSKLMVDMFKALKGQK